VRALFEHGARSRKWSLELQKVAVRKLQQLNAATHLDDLRAPPGNRLELLRGERGGRYSIRINAQFRICFSWRDDGVHEVEIVDYH
jgi:toxin HigB-1